MFTICIEETRYGVTVKAAVAEPQAGLDALSYARSIVLLKITRMVASGEPADRALVGYE
jgi:hypothetical protein